MAFLAKKQLSSPSPPRPDEKDPLIFSEVYEENFTFVWRSLRGLGVAPALIDDATQDAFVVVHRKLENVPWRSSLRSWLYGIARRVAKDYRRSAERRGTVVELDEARARSSSKNAEEELTQRRILRRVEEFTDSLDEEWRALFVLAELHQLPVREASAIVGVNMNTAYSRLKTMRRSLEGALAGLTTGDRQ